MTLPDVYPLHCGEFLYKNVVNLGYDSWQTTTAMANMYIKWELLHGTPDNYFDN